MTLGTIHQFILPDAFFLVFLGYFFRLVFVAPITGVFDVATRVAYLAGDFSLLAMIQGKSVHA
jgi:hypothetical protein